jgi:hypothetical protein
MLTHFIEAQNINFPDSNFKNYLVNARTDFSFDHLTQFPLIDSNNDGEISQSEAFTQLDLSDTPNLLSLYLIAPINELDLSTNSKLITIGIDNCSVQNLDLSACTNLEIVSANNNQMETINFGTLKHVTIINLSNNLLTNLNVNNMFNLFSLQCENNLLQKLSIKNNNVQSFSNGNIVFGGNPTLETICCDSNEIIYLENLCNTYGYTSVDIGDCPEIVARQNITMYPNPVKNILHIDCDDKINRVEVFGSNGSLIMSSDALSNAIDMQSYQNGMYFLKVYRDTTIDTMKFIKN